MKIISLFEFFSDIEKIKNGMGEKLALLDQYLSIGVASVITSLIYGWKLTLVMLAASPLLIISGVLVERVCIGLLF